MRSAFVALAVVIAATPAAEACPIHHLDWKYITIGADAAPDALALDGSARVVEVDGDVDIVAIPEHDLDALANVMHERFDRCGGFIVHDSLADARAAPPPRRPGPGYTIDRGAIVTPALAVLDKTLILPTIRELSAMPTRRYDSPGGAEASRWLAERWRSFAAGRDDVTVELIDHGWAQASVVLTIPGTSKADEVVVLGGHLDSISMRGRTADAPGADDDASGIATLTEVVRVLLSTDYRPARTIQVMAYAAEEVGLRGSQAIARDYRKRGVDVVGALQLDMTNYQGSEKDIWLMKDFTSAAQNAFVGRLIDTYTHATWGQDACGYACSDHASWYRAGVPASMPFESRMRDHNRAIHTARDTLEMSNDNADHAVVFGQLAVAYAIEMAKGEVRGDSRGDGGGSDPLALLAVLGVIALALAPSRVR